MPRPSAGASAATLHAAHVLSDASLLMMTGGVDYVSMSTIYEDAHDEAKGKLERTVRASGRHSSIATTSVMARCGRASPESSTKTRLT